MRSIVGRLDEPPAIDAARLVFVGGLHRSGTTLLAKLLTGHPDVSGLSNTGVWEDEGQHLQDVYPPAADFGGLGRFAFADRAHLTERSTLVSDRSRQVLLQAWEPYWDTSRALLVEKSPPNLIRFRFLQALFPGARFVAVIRHPIPVSYATQRLHRPWDRPSVYRLIHHWIRAHEIFEDDASRLDGVIVVRYEWLTRDPADVLGRVADQLGLSGGFASSPVTVETDRSERYFAKWRRHLANPVLGRLRRQRARRMVDDVRHWDYSLLEE
jgi:hypothetical protein